MAELIGRLCGKAPGARAFHVGAFPGPRIAGRPVAWTTLTAPGPFRLAVPAGNWYIHAVGGVLDRNGFLGGSAFGSHGGIYGHGTPLSVGDGPPPRALVHVSPLWRDLTHVPHHRQPALSDEQWRAVHTASDALAADLDGSRSDQLGRTAGLTRTRLSALFKRATGLTLEEYRIRLRLEAAKALLVGSDWDVTAVALEVSYSTPAQLGRMFRRYLGVSPGEFRRLARTLLLVAPGEAEAAATTPATTPATAQAPATREPADGDGPGTLLRHALLRLTRRGGTLHGEVRYGGAGRGVVIYISAFPGPFPDTYPAAWTAVPAPGPFTLRGVPPGRHYILACYCRRRMLYPGDFHTAFAYGGHGALDTTGQDPWEPLPVTVGEGETVAGITVDLVDGDRAAAMARPWSDAFLPDGR